MARAGALRGRLRALAALLLAGCCCARAGAASPAAQTDVIASLTAEEGVPPGAGVVITAGLADGKLSEGVASLVLEWTTMPAQQPTDGTPPALPPRPLQSVAMSKLPDLEGGWRATVPLDGLGPGSLVRYAVTALDANGIELARRPSSVDTDGQARYLCAQAVQCGALADAGSAGCPSLAQRIYRGYVVGWHDIAAQSAVPALHWFVADPEKARWDDPTPGSVAFDAGHGMHYYDEVRVCGLPGCIMTYPDGCPTGGGAPRGQRAARRGCAAAERGDQEQGLAEAQIRGALHSQALCLGAGRAARPPHQPALDVPGALCLPLRLPPSGLTAAARRSRGPCRTCVRRSRCAS